MILHSLCAQTQSNKRTQALQIPRFSSNAMAASLFGLYGRGAINSLNLHAYKDLSSHTNELLNLVPSKFFSTLVK